MKNIKITKSQLEFLTEKVQQKNLEEGILGGIKDVYRGLKGVWRGEGFDYFKYLSTLQRLTKDLKKLDIPNKKIMTQLTDLKNKISVSKMPTDKRDNLIKTIDDAMSHFDSYSNLIDKIETAATQKVS